MKRAGEDPFGERRSPGIRKTLCVLGRAVRFECDDRRLLALVDAAYGGAPPARGGETPFDVSVWRAADAAPLRGSAPPAARMSAGAGLLCGVVDAANYALISPMRRQALISLSTAMLKFPYHARYELIEFAVLTLLARAVPLVPLHAACFALGGNAVLLLGDSGAGKSTLCLEALQQRFDFVSEDSVFVTPRGLRAFGPSAYLHVQAGSLRFLRDASLARLVRRSPVIRRRSGARKSEVDLRRADVRLAHDGPRLEAVVVLKGADRPASRAKLVRLAGVSLTRVLRTTQPYAAGLPEWQPFCRRLAKLPAFELHRGANPAQSLALLREWLTPAAQR